MACIASGLPAMWLRISVHVTLLSVHVPSLSVHVSLETGSAYIYEGARSWLHATSLGDLAVKASSNLVLEYCGAAFDLCQSHTCQAAMGVHSHVQCSILFCCVFTSFGQAPGGANSSDLCVQALQYHEFAAEVNITSALHVSHWYDV